MLTGKTCQEITDQISKHRKEILDNLNQESVDVYRFLKREYAKGDILNNHVFQFVFRSYYRLDGAGLGGKLKEKYFELMARKEVRLDIILSELSKIKTERKKYTVQFSFATKLLHTIDNKNPIYDKEVGRVIHRVVTLGDIKERIESAERIYADLSEMCPVLLADKKVQMIIAEFRKIFKVNKKEIRDSKVLDSILWSLGKINTKK